MDLGMAEERFDRDPDSARELVGEAREEAKRALAELRDLARGIRPSLLAERGLGPAIAALAARSPVPARARVDIEKRPPAQVETAAWFVVSEALANTAKHSGAQRATVWLTQRGTDLHVEVVDDGRGGADRNGEGLRGLVQRVAALDGSLEVNSPPGGPTVIRAVLPCA
jgi:signal transduction histidine kinase